MSTVQTSKSTAATPMGARSSLLFAVLLVGALLVGALLFGALLFGAMAWSTPAFAQAPETVETAPSAQDASSTPDANRTERADERRGPEDRSRLERARQRWRALTPERREELRKLHHALRDLDPEKRAALEERLRTLGPEKSRRLLRKWDRVRHSPEHEEIRHRIESLGRFGERLPPEERRRFRDLPPEEMRTFLEERVKRHLAEYRETLPEEERTAFDELSRRQQFGQLRRWHFDRAITRYRDGLSEEERTRFDALERREQAREVRRDFHRRHHGGFDRGGPPGDREGRSPRGGDAERGGRGNRVPRMIPPELREEFREIPQPAIRQYLEDGTVPEGVEISPELRAVLDEFPPPPRRAQDLRRGQDLHRDGARPGEPAGENPADSPRRRPRGNSPRHR